MLQVPANGSQVSSPASRRFRRLCATVQSPTRKSNPFAPAGRVTARELAESFEVSIRTIYRDIDELSAAGVPVYAEKGRNGGFEILGGYRTRLTGLDRSEAETLFLAGLPGAAAQLGLGEALAGMRLKLLAAL